MEFTDEMSQLVTSAFEKIRMQQLTDDTGEHIVNARSTIEIPAPNAGDVLIEDLRDRFGDLLPIIQEGDLERAYSELPLNIRKEMPSLQSIQQTGDPLVQRHMFISRFHEALRSAETPLAIRQREDWLQTCNIDETCPPEPVVSRINDLLSLKRNMVAVRHAATNQGDLALAQRLLQEETQVEDELMQLEDPWVKKFQLQFDSVFQ